MKKLKKTILIIIVLACGFSAIAKDLVYGTPKLFSFIKKVYLVGVLGNYENSVSPSSFLYMKPLKRDGFECYESFLLPKDAFEEEIKRALEEHNNLDIYYMLMELFYKGGKISQEDSIYREMGDVTIDYGNIATNKEPGNFNPCVIEEIHGSVYTILPVDFKINASQLANKIIMDNVSNGNMIFERQEIIDQLITKGFTEEEAIYGAENNAFIDFSKSLNELKILYVTFYSSHCNLSKKNFYSILSYNVFDKAEADKYVKILLEKDPRCFFDMAKANAQWKWKNSWTRTYYDDTVRMLLEEGFSNEEAEYGASHRIP